MDAPGDLGEFAGGAGGEPGGVIRGALVPHHIMESALLASQCLCAMRGGLQPYPPEEDVGRKVVTDGSDEEADVGERKLVLDRLMPEPRSRHGGDVTAVERLQGVQAAIDDLLCGLAEEEDLADARRGDLRIGVDRHRDAAVLTEDAA